MHSKGLLLLFVLVTVVATAASNSQGNGPALVVSQPSTSSSPWRKNRSQNWSRNNNPHTKTPAAIVNVASFPRGGDTATSAPVVMEATATVFDFLRGIDMFGTGLFAFSGALTAGRKGMDLLGMMIVAMITAVGGGTVRDLLMNRHGGVFWLHDSIYFKICATTTIFTFVAWPKLERHFGIKDSALPICIADAICLGAFAVVGTQKAIDLGYVDPILWIVFGLLTAVFGGVTRDILCLQRPRVMYPERTPYGGPPLLGSAVYASLIYYLQMNVRKAACISILTTFTARVLCFNSPRRLPHWGVLDKEDGEQ